MTHQGQRLMGMIGSALQLLDRPAGTAAGAALARRATCRLRRAHLPLRHRRRGAHPDPRARPRRRSSAPRRAAAWVRPVTGENRAERLQVGGGGEPALASTALVRRGVHFARWASTPAVGGPGGRRRGGGGAAGRDLGGQARVREADCSALLGRAARRGNSLTLLRRSARTLLGESDGRSTR
jgi:hypothetical protein